MFTGVRRQRFGVAVYSRCLKLSKTGQSGQSALIGAKSPRDGARFSRQGSLQNQLPIEMIQNQQLERRFQDSCSSTGQSR
eukprot:12115879-Alexandrium_andersonii.AAC.1